MNCSLIDSNFDILPKSQFTLFALTKIGNLLSSIKASKHEFAILMLEKMVPNMNNNFDIKNMNMDGITNSFNLLKENTTESHNEMKENFNNGETKNNFADMFNNSEMYMKTFQFFMPSMLSLNNKTFTPDMFKNMFNSYAYKGILDKMFNIISDVMENIIYHTLMACMK
jgi:hypothetical protein